MPLSPRLTIAVALVLFSTSPLGTILFAQPSPVLRWGGDAEGGAPYVEADPSDPQKLVGFDVEIAALIARELGRTPQFVQVAFASLDQSAARGDFDIGLSGIEDTPGRRAAVATSVPYYRFQEVLTVRQELAPGTSLAATDEQAKRVERLLDGIEGVKDYQVTVGSSGFLAAFGGGTDTNQAQYNVMLAESASSDEVVDRIEAGLKKLGRPIEIVVYPEADHAFANSTGERYDAKAAEDAWRRATAFLAAKLK